METVHGKKTVKPSHEENVKAKDGPIIDELQHPPSKPLLSRSGDLDLDSCPQMLKWSKQANAIVGASRAINIIIPDPTPKAVSSTFYNASRIILPILEKDSVPRFLRYVKEIEYGVIWRGMITPAAFNFMMIYGALKCAKVALEGQAPELNGCYANPNSMNQYGYFPLHQAAESFNVDMIKLLLDHGALTSVRTAGTEVVENLLPLHVAVENTCLHKYLEDNLFPNVDHLDYPTKVDDNYIYKLIHLLCLPEMQKIFLSTTRLLAENTGNLLDEIWNYINDCKVVQAAIILMAAQKHIRRGCSCKNGVTTVDGFSTIINRILHSMTLEVRMFENNENLQQQQQAKVKLRVSTLLLVNIISQAGEAIDAYIRAHSEASHAEVLDGVSSILKTYGFYSTGEVINPENLCPYKLSSSYGELINKNVSLAAKRITYGIADLPRKKGVIKRPPRGWTHQYTWLSFFPFWRSVLVSRCRVKVFPGHARFDRKRWPWSSSMDKVSSTTSDQNLTFSETIPQPSGLYQSKRAFGTAAMRFLKSGKVSSAIPNHNIGHLASMPQPGYYPPQRVLGAAALRILKVLRKA